MAKVFDSLNQSHLDFIASQKIFFIGSAASGKDTNVSPKGMFDLKSVGPNRLAYIHTPGSGNRTAEDIAAGNTVTLMFCSFDEKPLILRLYCRGEALAPGDPRFEELLPLWNGFAREQVRDIFVFSVHRVQESCGWGVPLFTYNGERPEGNRLRHGGTWRDRIRDFLR
ncbi:MAG: pyridoxamine 5'-phosphate oxidase family protein [Nitrospinae bacterium]|nr:pyridoxamine 5'-phosphate oxidase family protein [Nitrospinota bacterium]